MFRHLLFMLPFEFIYLFSISTCTLARRYLFDRKQQEKHYIILNYKIIYIKYFTFGLLGRSV